MKTGSIILIPFPYSELTKIKVRSAVVITETADKYSDLIISAISSCVPLSINRNEFLVTPTSMNNLRTTSVVKVDRIMTIKRNMKIADLGMLDEPEIKLLSEKFKALIDND